jgi:hypothetical protein
MGNPRRPDERHEQKYPEEDKRARPRGARVEGGLTCKHILISLMLATAGAIGLEKVFKGSPVNIKDLTPREQDDFVAQRGGVMEEGACNFLAYNSDQLYRVSARTPWRPDIVYTPPRDKIDRTVECLRYKLINARSDQSFRKGFKKEYITEFEKAFKEELTAHQHQFPHEMEKLTSLLSTGVRFAPLKVSGGDPSQLIYGGNKHVIGGIDFPGWSGISVHLLLDSPYKKEDFTKVARDIIKSTRERNVISDNRQISASTPASPSPRGRGSR